MRYPFPVPRTSTSNLTTPGNIFNFRWHREGAYTHFMTKQDQIYLAAVNEFNPYDLYSKADQPIDIDAVRPYYQGLIAKFFPAIVEW